MKQGDIWTINLNPIIGAEIKKIRPAVIVNDNTLGKLPLKIIVPLTDWKEDFKFAPWMIKIAPNEENGLNKLSSADCFQVRSVSIKRFEKRLGEVSIEIQEKIKVGLKRILTIA